MVHPFNVFPNLLSRCLGAVTLASPLQPKKQEKPILVTPMPIVTLVRPLQPWNA